MPWSVCRCFCSAMQRQVRVSAHIDRIQGNDVTNRAASQPSQFIARRGLAVGQPFSSLPCWMAAMARRVGIELNRTPCPPGFVAPDLSLMLQPGPNRPRKQTLIPLHTVRPCHARRSARPPLSSELRLHSRTGRRAVPPRRCAAPSLMAVRSQSDLHHPL
jgi:hypothetical protein